MSSSYFLRSIDSLSPRLTKFCARHEVRQLSVHFAKADGPESPDRVQLIVHNQNGICLAAVEANDLDSAARKLESKFIAGSQGDCNDWLAAQFPRGDKVHYVSLDTMVGRWRSCFSSAIEPAKLASLVKYCPFAVLLDEPEDMILVLPDGQTRGL